MNALRHWLLHKTSQVILVSMLLALHVGILAVYLYRHGMEEEFQHLLDGQVQREADRLELETMRGQAMGVARYLGLNEPTLKELASATRPHDDTQTLSRMRVARLMLGADGIYILDNKGKIIVHETDHDSSTGKNVRFRPYWQQAMAGKENVYLAVGSRSGERGIYIASPIRAGTTPQDAVIGVILIKLLGDQLDRKLTTFGVKALLLSPQGVVFASTEEEWLLRIHGIPTPERMSAISSLNQFGKSYERGSLPDSLPFDLNDPTVWIQGKRFALATTRLQWNDPAGEWSLVLLGDLEPVTPLSVMGTIGLSAGIGLLLLQLVALRAWREWHSRREAITRTRETAEKLVAEATIKSRYAEVGTALQQARDLEGVAQVWFRQLSGYLPIHQGTLYVVEQPDSLPDSLLIRAGVHADEQAPERIQPGEGLIGQCALDQQPLRFSLPQDDPVESEWRIQTGLGASRPRTLLLLPVLRRNRVLAILQLASLDPGFLNHQPLIEELLPLLASNLEIVLIARHHSPSTERPS